MRQTQQQITDRLKIYWPEAQWAIRGDTYADLEWLSTDIPKPTAKELFLEE